jgi:hypothetical protein
VATRASGAPLTFAEACEITGLSENELRDRIDLSQLVIQIKPGIGRREVIPKYALAAIGAIDHPLTRHERYIEGLIEFLRRKQGGPASTHDAATASGLNRPATLIALQVLRVLGLVRRSKEPQPNGAGGHRDAWRWIGD